MSWDWGEGWVGSWELEVEVGASPRSGPRGRGTRHAPSVKAAGRGGRLWGEGKGEG